MTQIESHDRLPTHKRHSMSDPHWPAAVYIENILAKIHHIITELPVYTAVIREHDVDGLVQERRNSIANALELHLSCTKLCYHQYPKN